MRTKLKLFKKWGITFEEPYEIEEKPARKVAYVDKQEVEEENIVFCQVYFLNFAVKIPFFTKRISLYLAGQIMHPVA